MCQRKPAAHSEDGFLDADVFTEKVRVDAMSSHEIAAHNLVLNNVTKYYRNILAVNQLSIVIREYIPIINFYPSSNEFCSV